MLDDPTQVNTVEDNASSFIEEVNTLFAENNVLDEDGNPAELKAYAGSPTWLMALAQGQITTEWQERLRKTYYSLDIENCEDEQVLALATLAGVLRREQTAPMIVLSVTNPYEDAITLNPTNCYATDEFDGNRWAPGNAYTLAGNEHQNIIFYCEDKQATCPSGVSFTLHSINTEWEDFSVSSLNSSMTLSSEETTAELRNRILLGLARFDPITRAQEAIVNLNGIVKCSIYFNPDANESVELSGGITLPPRTAFMVIQGADVDNLIANTYFKYVNVQTLNGEDFLSSETLVGASRLFVYYRGSYEVYPKIKIIAYLRQGADPSYKQQIKQVLLQNQYALDIGEPLTSQKVDFWLDSANAYGLMIDSKLSVDGLSWSDMYTPPIYGIPVIQEENIVFEERYL